MHKDKHLEICNLIIQSMYHISKFASLEFALNA